MVPQSSTMLAALKVGKNAMKGVDEITGLASDSRAVQPGYLFAALCGTRDDGARFVEDAVARGAVAVLGRPELAERASALGVRFIAAENPRLALAREAAAFYGAQPRCVAAITGTNGKTSVTVFLRQIWTALGQSAASLGTIGAVTGQGRCAAQANHARPDRAARAACADEGGRRRSSRGGGPRATVSTSTASTASTFPVSPSPTSPATISTTIRPSSTTSPPSSGCSRTSCMTAAWPWVNADAEHAERFIEAAARRGLRLVTVGEKGDDIKLLSCTPRGDGQTLSLRHGGRSFAIELPLAGHFQASNALVAAGLAIGLGSAPASVFATLGHLKGAPGRLERVAVARNGAPIYVDYAHTPDALQTVLKAIRPHTQGRLHLVFGCGGDRDKGKRPLMGEAAALLADDIIVTDDNPRSEDPAQIRREILAACPGAREIADRAEAIRAGVASLVSGDVLVIAGKGHESGQTIGSETRPFSDRDQAVKESAA